MNTIYVDSKEQDSFIGTVHPKHDHITVVGWDGMSKTNNGNKLYDIRCSECAKDSELFGNGIFKYTKSDFYKYVPCGCSKSHRWSKEQYKILLLRICKQNNYKFVDFLIDTKYIVLECPIHGQWNTTTYKSLLSHKCGCPKCANGVPTDKQFKEYMCNNFPTIIVKGNYIHSLEKIECQCSICNNVWNAIPHNLRIGTGCPDCATNGFKLDSDGYLYINQSSCGVTKIGITNNDLRTRVSSQNRSSGLNFETKCVFYHKSGRVIKNLETEILHNLKLIYKQPSIKCDGYTEMFLGVCLDYINGLIKEKNSDGLVQLA